MSEASIPTSVRVAVRARDAGHCVRCGVGGQLHVHHRQRRRDGGHGLANCISLCSTCHHWVHANPILARDGGFIVSAFAPDVSVVPLRWYSAMDVTLNDDGQVLGVPSGPEQVAPLVP